MQDDNGLAQMRKSTRDDQPSDEVSDSDSQPVHHDLHRSRTCDPISPKETGATGASTKSIPGLLQAPHTLGLDELASTLKTSTDHGLDGAEALRRLTLYGHNNIKVSRDFIIARILLQQVVNPLIILLIAIAALSFYSEDRSEAAVILGIIVASITIG
ncbi:hypothetical protein F5Y16DRAFT_250027 [Xylariaceae sp. FL0255]|nr:hypothetical protein F5Y16DRAFT_250027 [Xylariaceae sp. FL0255]